MPKNIIVIGTGLPHDELEFAYLHSKHSLLDYDISVFNPDISPFYGYQDDYRGKPCLSDTNSVNLQEQLAHWRREILGAVTAGKTVFLLLNELQEVYVATGEKSYSGTGRNRQVTRHVTPYSNYALIPGGIDVVNSKGTSMTLCGKDNVLATYWAELGPASEFRVLISGEGVRPLVITKTGNKTVGAYLRYKNAPGALFLLPYIDFEREDFTYVKRGKTYWTDKATQIGKQFVSAIVNVDKVYRQGGEVTPAPDWVAQEKFVLPKEQQIRSKLLTLETKIDILQKEKEQLQQTLAAETELKGLLYEKGKPLEAAILRSLKLIGFETSQYRDSESEFDIVFESKEGRLIGEAEGKDNKAVNIDKLRQLEMNIHEDFTRDEVKEMAKGALIGNAYRFLPPEDRSDFFTEKCLTAAKRSNIVLIKATDLFYVSRYLSAKVDKVFAKRCRQAILAAVGVVVFPNIPEYETQAPQTVVINPN
ncbi:hypothetical protein ES708_16113 [subsurface metagenome]